MSIGINSIDPDARNGGWQYGNCRFLVTANARILRGVMTCVETGVSISGGEITQQGASSWLWVIEWPSAFFRWTYDQRTGYYTNSDSTYRFTVYGEGGDGDVAQQTVIALGGSIKTPPPQNLRVNGYDLWNYNASGTFLIDSKAELTWEYPIGGTATPFTVTVYCMDQFSSTTNVFTHSYQTDESSFRVPISDLRASAVSERYYLQFRVTSANGGQSRLWAGYQWSGQGGTVAYWDGTRWVTCYANYYDGAKWNQTMPYYWNGSRWVECSH